MQTTENKLKLTQHQAAAVRAVITEINQLAVNPAVIAFQRAHLEFKRLTDMLQADADLDPMAYTIDGIEDVQGVPHLKLRPVPKSEPAPQKPTE
jgi:hypothetical protein